MAAIYPLVNVASVLAVATNGLFHAQAPQGTAPPYAVLQAPATSEAMPVMQGGQVAIGQEIRFQLRAVSSAPDYAEAILILQAGIQLLDGAAPAVANHQLLRLWFEWSRVYEDPEMVNGVPVWNGVAQFCALLDQVS
jgi:hypothetical protein